MMLSLKKFSPNDIYFIETDYAFPKESREMFANYKNAVGYTAFHDGTIVALGGVHVIVTMINQSLIDKHKYKKHNKQRVL